MKRLTVMMAFIACGPPPPQGQDEASVTYKLKFAAEAGVSTRVIFPLPTEADPAMMPIQQTIQISDGGTISWVTQASATDVGAALDAHGTGEASYFIKALTGYTKSTGVPEATLSMHQPDAGPGEMYLYVNKGGSAQVMQVDFEYTVSRDCGSGCGGKRSWKFSGPVGLSLQPVHMDYVEEKR